MRKYLGEIEHVDPLVPGVGAKCKGGEEEQEQNRVVFTRTAKVTKKTQSLHSLPSKDTYFMHVALSGQFPTRARMQKLNQRPLWKMNKRRQTKFFKLQ